MRKEPMAPITGRALIVGELVLTSPLLIGAGTDDRDEDRDIRVLKTKDGSPFIPGTSLCGVLREFLLSHAGKQRVDTLFGDPKNGQSMLVVEDILLTNGKTSSRDGVCIDSLTGIGEDNKKYDYEVVEPGARGKFRLLLTRRRCHEEDWKKYRNLLLLLRDKLEGGIALGAMTAKGFGRAKAEKIRAGFYDFHNPEDVRAWLEQPDPQPETASDRLAEKTSEILFAEGDFVINADFVFRTSFIIRDYGREKLIPNSREPNKLYNAVSMMRGDGKYILPGTSLKGTLRHHSEHILRKLGLDDSFLNNLMGSSKKGDDGKDIKIKSRFIVEESVLNDEAIHPAGQTRIRIDRFTGGVIDSALLVNEPLWQKKAQDAAFRLTFTIKKAQPEEIGLALFLLRDLWQGKVAVGGEKSVGRGTLQGLGGSITHYTEGQAANYTLDADGKLSGANRDSLDTCVEALLKGTKKEAAAK